LLVYTPAGYEASRKQYPVIYLLHGSDGVAGQWSSDGRMEHLADNLIAAGRMPEAILVSPDVNIPGSFFSGTERYMTEEVIPFIDDRYRTLAGSATRSIVGISRGGNQAFHVAFKRPDLFSALGAFSINLGVLNSQTYASLADVGKVNQQIRTFVYAGGMDDNLIPFVGVEAAHQKLLQLGVAHEFMPIPGDHAWQSWRNLFREFVGRL
jgi:enterochelin esterase family protein